MNLNLTDRRITTALAAVFLLGLACVLLLVLAVLVVCAMLVNALVGTISEAVATVITLYTNGGPLTHLLFLAGVLVGIPYSFKRLRIPVLRFCQRQFARFTAFAQREPRPSPAPDPTREEEREEDRPYMEGEVVDLDESSEDTNQARTTTAPPTAGQHTTRKSRKQRKKQKRARQTRTSARAVLALTHA